MMPTAAKLFRIKPLEWEWFEDHQQRGWKTGNGIYMAYVRQFQVIENCWSQWQWSSNHKDPTHCASPEEGKQLAEQHWNEYIKQALIEVE